ncbi:AAA family ATPase [Amycolatopsis pittospori]|uniref:AAA family ATPase n=1 Tax=Amycolatopsis pittospori TaxID=2749434 RepID=UPI001F1EDEF9|nr:AAA family ATPase [Amycolatopsis pittospori]
MPRLIVLNGPPACGKSTLARRYADDRPLTLNLDIDRVRGLLGAWQDDAAKAGRLARDLAVSAARTHLTAGHDVIVPQYLGRTDFLRRLEALAERTGAEFHEIVLLDTKENALRRFADRTRAAAEPEHVEAAETLRRSGGRDHLAEMYDRIVAVVAERPRAKVVRTDAGQISEAYQGLLAALG